MRRECNFKTIVGLLLLLVKACAPFQGAYFESFNDRAVSPSQSPFAVTESESSIECLVICQNRQCCASVVFDESRCDLYKFPMKSFLINRTGAEYLQRTRASWLKMVTWTDSFIGKRMLNNNLLAIKIDTPLGCRKSCESVSLSLSLDYVAASNACTCNFSNRETSPERFTPLVGAVYQELNCQ